MTRARMQFIAPAFVTADVRSAVEFYTSMLGFELIGDHPGLKILERESARVHFLVTENVASSKSAKGGCCIYVDDVDRLYAEFAARGVAIAAAPVTRPWGYRDFSAIDPDGHELLFAQHLQRDAQ
jgi:catechol 2,3-dioxygenase-like lactoylglutathione lyase family enzyme